MTSPWISVVVPVFNGARFLAEALESVRWQTLPVRETIVVDDGSTDESASIAESFPDVRCLRQPNAGVSAARNAGIAVCRGDQIALLDADDIWLPDALERLAGALLAAPEDDFVYAFVRPFLDPTMNAAPSWVRPGMLETHNEMPTPSSWLVRRDTFERIGVFDPSYPVYEDVEWLARARRAGLTGAVVSEVVVLKRVHDRNLTGRREDARLANLRLLRRMASTRGIPFSR